MRSFIKYPGGKNHVYPYIKEVLPKDFISYHEPFVGSGSIFLNLSYDLELVGKNSYLSDTNTQLILTWEVIKNHCDELITDINSLSGQFDSEEFYYTLREMDRLPYFNTTRINKIRKASRFIILNKLGFNGLVRHSKKGFNNVPWGKKSNSFGFLDDNKLKEIQNYLQNTSLTYASYKEMIEPNLFEPKELIYLDPPYTSSQKGKFIGYLGIWKNEDHYYLAEKLEQLTKKGVYWILSGHDKSEYRELYKNYQIKTIPVVKRIAANSKNRKTIKELLIWNY